MKFSKYDEQNKNYWLNSIRNNTIRPKLKESLNVDIAILGAGFTGLWTAYYLKKKSPSLRIAIFEKEEVGYGASGRNGGWCSPKFSVTPSKSIERFGLEETKKLFHTMIGSVKEIEKVIENEKLEVDWKKSGSLKVARGEHLLPKLEEEMNIYKNLNLEKHFSLLSETESNEHIQINNLKGSILTNPSAVVHPGKLVKQLAHILEEKGIDIYEQTKILKYKEGSFTKKPELITKNGKVTAEHAVVVAGESYLSQLSAFKRRIIPMYTSIVLTEPLSDSQWKEIGWENRETIGSTNLSVDYLQRTKDNRILFGLGNSAPYHYASKMKEKYTTYEPSISLQKKRALKWFPNLKESQFSYKWGGPIGVTRDWTPNIKFNNKTKIAHAWGFAGQGVSTSNLAGRILCDLIHEEETLETTLPMVNHTSPKWELEPFRWLGAKYIKFAMNRLDDKSETEGIAPKGKTIAEKLIEH